MFEREENLTLLGPWKAKYFAQIRVIIVTLTQMLMMSQEVNTPKSLWFLHQKFINFFMFCQLSFEWCAKRTLLGTKNWCSIVEIS